MATRGVDFIVHAAALKRRCRRRGNFSPFECIRTNVSGAENVVRAAIRNNVPRVIALSTDKAPPIRWINSSTAPRSSPRLRQDLHRRQQYARGRRRCSRFAVVRYGNVVGSRGSVIPFFKKLIEENAEFLPVTDKRMTRFWITLQQGVNFVILARHDVWRRDLRPPDPQHAHHRSRPRSSPRRLPLKIVGIRPGDEAA